MNAVKLPGMRGAGLYDVLYFLWKSLQNPRFNLAAMAMSYRFFFAVFPALILIFTLIPYVPVPNLKEEALGFLKTVAPEDSLGFMYHVVEEFFQKPSVGVIYLNIALLAYAATSGISVMMQAFSKDHESFRKRGFFASFGVALLIFVLLLVVFVVVMLLLVGGEWLIQDLELRGLVTKDGFRSFLIRTLNYVVLFVSIQVAVSVIYFLGPSLHRRWTFFTPGSLVAGLLIVLANLAFQYFVVSFADYNKIYGSLGALMLMMVWFYWLSIVLLIGFELNAAIDRALSEGRNIAVQAAEDTALAKGDA